MYLICDGPRGAFNFVWDLAWNQAIARFFEVVQFYDFYNVRGFYYKVITAKETQWEKPIAK